VSPILSVRSLCVRRTNNALLDDLSFDLAAGRVLALLGPNGAGKSTLLNALACEIVATQGEVLMNGKSLASFDAHELAEIRALNAVEPPLAFALSVFDYVALGRPFDSLRVSEVERALVECQAKQWIDRDATSLSSGELLRVQLARSLYQLNDAQNCLWLLDEPMAHLDLAQRQFALQLLRRIANERQWAIMFSTHEPRDAQAIADDVLLLREGKVIAHGTVGQRLRSAELSACYGIAVTLHDVSI
jgi:iron complex transport system ATP-binding protein